jgi:uncharacterized cupredoxin-like copper-binding protein
VRVELDMKTLIALFIGVCVGIGVVRAEGPGQTIKDTAKAVGHGIKNTAKATGEAIQDALEPEPRARRVEVTLSDYAIAMPSEAKPVYTAFVVHNSGKHAHNFEVAGNGTDKKFITSVEPGKTKVLHVDLARGSYKVWCPVDKHADKGMRTTLNVH